MSLSLSNYEVAFGQRADILLVNDLAGVQYSTKTNGEGVYVVLNLPSGPCRLQVSKGAKPFPEKAGCYQVTLFLSSFFQSAPIQPSRRCRHPSIRTLYERYSLGARWVFLFQQLQLPDYRPLFPTFSVRVGPPLVAVTWTRRLSSVVSDRNSLGYCPHRLLAIAQWFVHLSAYPQAMQPYRQLSSYGNHGSFLGIFSSSLRKFPSPSPQITLFPKRPQHFGERVRRTIKRLGVP
jgi:hypothetical protein